MHDPNRTDVGEPAPDQGSALAPDESVPEAVTRGRWWATPFVVVGGVAVGIWMVAAAISAIALLAWWLL